MGAERWRSLLQGFHTRSHSLRRALWRRGRFESLQVRQGRVASFRPPLGLLTTSRTKKAPMRTAIKHHRLHSSGLTAKEIGSLPSPRSSPVLIFDAMGSTSARIGLVVLPALADAGQFHAANLTVSLVLVNEMASMTSFGDVKGTTETGEADGLVSEVMVIKEAKESIEVRRGDLLKK